VDLSSPDWTRDAVGYQIFVRSFADSNGDGIGDLNGLISKLDYLNDGKAGGTDLEVNLLYLMPIHPSPSYHGYDVTDYQAINPQYGSLEDFKRLCKEAHQRGMRVIIDWVLNHSSIAHPWFADESKRDWYIWRDSDPGWTRPWGGGPVWHPQAEHYYYGLFWSGMPDLNLRQPLTVKAMIEAMHFWSEQGVDGFRVDAARYLIEEESGEQADTHATHALAKDLKRHLREVDEDGLWLAEAWTTTEIVATYAGDNDEFDLAFNFDLAQVIPIALMAEEPLEIERCLRRTEQGFSKRGFDAPFLTNHDMDRLRTSLNGATGPLRPAMALLLSLPGTPFLYYGEELGMANALSCQGDVCRRAPMAWQAGPGAGFSSVEPWTAPAEDSATVNVETQAANPDSLLNLTRRMIALRRQWPAMRSDERVMLTTDQSAVYAMLRGRGAGSILVLLNFSETEKTSTVDLSGVGRTGEVLKGRDLFDDRELSFPAERSRHMLEELPPYGLRLISFE